MADLAEFKRLIASLHAEHKSAKILFIGRSNGRMHTGSVLVCPQGICNINYQDKKIDAAIEDMCLIQYEKLLVMSASKEETQIDPGSQHVIDTDALLARLVLHPVPPQQKAPVIEAEQESKDAIIFVASEPLPQAVAEKAFELSSAEALSLVKACRVILEKHYDAEAARMIDEISAVHWPKDQPKDFLDECKKMLVAMVGLEKADKVFKPLYEKIS
jgi:hypothetical protein